MAKVNMSEVSEQIRGVSYKPEDIMDSSEPGAVGILRANNISNGKINYDDLVYVRKTKVSEKQMLKKGDILICTSSGSKNLVGKAAQVQNDCGYSFGAFCKVIRPKNVLPEFLGMYYQSKSYRAYILSVSEGANINNIKNQNIDAISFPKYLEEDQKKISNILMKVQSLIDYRKCQLEELDLLIKARFVEMFGTVNKPQFKLKTLPEFVCTDKNSIKRGPFGGSLKKDDFVEKGYLVYEQRHAIHNDFAYAKYYITYAKYQEMIGFKVMPSDLLISCSGVTLGRIAEVPQNAREGIINQALLKLSLDQRVMNNVFFINQFRTNEIQNTLFGFSRGSGIPNMPSMAEIKSVKFICPPIELQNDFATFVHQVDKSKFAVQKSLEEAQLLFDSLIQKYFG